jgi:predicted component of type VI protein secretion system
MKKIVISVLAVSVLLSGCIEEKKTESSKTSATVERQQAQFSAAQPIPTYDWSLERDLLIQLYNIRNIKALTHSVWRSNYGSIEGDCASIGFGIPYDTSLTNPLVATDTSQSGDVD